jgi:nitroreductase
MNPVMHVLLNRRSVRVYEDRPIGDDEKDQILSAAFRAPTAGNLMLYSIVEVKDQATKDRLAVTCDNQPFIAKAPLVLLFLADYQRWYDTFVLAGVPEACREKGEPMRRPEEGDLFLACCDALIAAQTTVVAAESLGIGSCYIGDIMENYEIHRGLFNLPQYVFPIALVCFGYPTQQQKERPQPTRYGREYVVFADRYRRLSAEELTAMHQAKQERMLPATEGASGARNVGQAVYTRKFSADYSKEMRRSVRAMLKVWTGAS